MSRRLAALLCALLLPVAVPAAAETPLLLYGGDDSDVFLGCLNCGKYDESSVCNVYGAYGSEYQADSIWNRYGTYGSKYSRNSPWGDYAAYPPAIRDKAGGFYGYMAVNTYAVNRTTVRSVLDLLAFESKADDLVAARKFWCGS